MPKKRKLTPEKEQEYREWGLKPPEPNPEASKRGKKSRRKGKVGQREVKKVCEDNGVTARILDALQVRGGTTEAPDVEAGMLDIEVKRQKRPNLTAAYRQAQTGRRSGQYAVAATRADNAEWLATLSLEDLLDLYADAMRWRERA